MRTWSALLATIAACLLMTPQSASVRAIHKRLTTEATTTSVSTSASNLPFSDINILVLTDVHSWVGKNRHDPLLNADYGNVLSFYEHLQILCADLGQDLFFVMNGDFVDGTGLTTLPPAHLTPILRHMPWDALTIGNHELYDNSTIEFITGTYHDHDHDDNDNDNDNDNTGDYSGTGTGTGNDNDNGILTNDVGGDINDLTIAAAANQAVQNEIEIEDDDTFVNHWKGRYLTSNTLLKETQETIGERYAFLRGPMNNHTLLTFGFLYNFQSNCEITTVERVQEVIEQPWFANVLSGAEGDFDAIVVLAHMGATDPLVVVLLEKIREVCGEFMAVQFITGHTHVRSYHIVDDYSTSFEAGRYLDTVGFVSFSLNGTDSVAAAGLGVGDGGPRFHHEYIDANVDTFKDMLGVDYTETAKGKQLSELIYKTQKGLGLFRVLGCAPETYFVSHGMEKTDSLWSLYANKVIPDQLFWKKESNVDGKKVMVQKPGSLRYDLYGGNVTVDDIISVCPFNDTIYRLEGMISGSDLTSAFGEPNFVEPNLFMDEQDPKFWRKEHPEWVISGNVDPNEEYVVYTLRFDIETVQKKLETVTGAKPDATVLEDMTTFDLWNDYIQDEWICPKPEEIEENTSSWQKFVDFFEQFTVVKAISFVLTFIVLVFFGWMFLCRNNRPKQGSNEEGQFYHDCDDDSEDEDIDSMDSSFSSDAQSTPRGGDSPRSVTNKKPYHPVAWDSDDGSGIV